MTEQHLILGLGELLWDVLPEGERLGGVPIDGSLSKGHLGGAPSNFAVMAGRLGDHAAILSRIGRDDLGRQAVDVLDLAPVDSSHLQVDTNHATGRVTVMLESGQPRFTIH